MLPFSPRGAHRRDGASLEAIRFRLTRPFIDRPAAVVRDTQNGEGRESLRGDYEAAQTDGVTFADYLDVVRRHRWFIILMGIGVAVGVAVFTARQAQDYKASAQVIELGATGPTGLNSTEIDRRAQTDASLARTPLLAAKVLQATGTKESTDDFLSHSSVNAAASSDVLTFTVKDAKAALAVNLVNAYARGFAKYRTDVGQAAFNRAKESLEANIETIEAQLEQARAAANGSPSPTVSVLSQRYASLLDEQQRLQTAQAVDSTNLVVVPATRAVRGGPHLARNAIVGLVFGLLLGTILSFVREALDPRIRTAQEVSEELGLPLLGRIPSPRQSAQRARLVMLEQPRSPAAEPFRILRTNVEFANRPFGASTIMIVGAVADDERTTIVGNLGVSFARAGRRVMLVDLDLRDPSLHELFGLPEGPGITDLAMKRARLTQALTKVPLTDPSTDDKETSGWSGKGTLTVVQAGTMPPDPGDFVGMQPLSDVLQPLAERSDLVLIDSPPVLAYSDAVALSANVDAIIVALKLGALTRQDGDELRRILDVCPSPKLGYVITGGDGSRPPEPSTPPVPRTRVEPSARAKSRDPEASDVT